MRICTEISACFTMKTKALSWWLPLPKIYLEKLQAM
jgi:hypothetical protein